MPKGIVTATVAINNANNAGLLAAQILALFDKKVEKNLPSLEINKLSQLKLNQKIMKNIILGICGSGQLSMMLCQAAKKLEIKTIVLTDDKNGPAKNYCDEFFLCDLKEKNKRICFKSGFCDLRI